MKKSAGLLLLLLPLILLDQRCAHAGPLSILGVAGQYNVFVFGDLTLSQTDVEGRAAAGGNVTLDSFSIGSRVPAENGIPSLVAGQDVTLTNGSVGCQSGTPACVAPKQGAIVYGSTANLPNGTAGYGSATQDANFIDFGATQTYLNGLSRFWGGLAANGTDVDPTTNFDLTGTNLTLNIFSLQAADIMTTALTGPSFNFHAPAGSTILVNIAGDLATLDLRNISFTFNGIPGENTPAAGEIYSHNAGFPYSDILFNFPDATQNIALDRIAVNGSIVAPFANVTFTTDSHIDGNLVALSLSGQGESHAIPFAGIIPASVPEPGTLLLLAGGFAAMLARRRRK